MAKQVEEVEVVFTADTEQYQEAVDESTNSTNNFNANLGSFLKTSILAGAALLKVNFVMKIFNIQTLLGIQNVTLFNITFVTLAKTIINKLVPAFVKVRLAIIATGIGAFIVALGAVIILINNTVAGTRELDIAMKALGNIMEAIVGYFVGLAKATIGLWTGDWNLIVEGFSQSWEAVSVGIGNSVSNAVLYVEVQNLIAKNGATINLQAAQNAIALANVNKQLESSKLSMNDRNVLLVERNRLELQGIKNEEDTLFLKQQSLIVDRNSTTIGPAQVKIQAELNDLAAEILAVQQKRRVVNAQLTADLIASGVSATDAAKLTAQLEEQARIDKINADNAAILAKIDGDAAAFKILDDQQAEARQKESDRLNRAFLQFEDGLAEEIRLTQEAEDEKARIKADALKLEESQFQSFEDFKIGATKQGFAIAGQLASENQQARGAIMIAEALANTALGISRAPADYGVGAAIAIPIIAALGAAQVALIAKNMGASGGSVDSPQAPTRQEQTQVDTAFGNLDSRPQIVLVTEDLNTVQSRVAVTESRASIG